MKERVFGFLGTGWTRKNHLLLESSDKGLIIDKAKEPKSIINWTDIQSIETGELKNFIGNFKLVLLQFEYVAAYGKCAKIIHSNSIIPSPIFICFENWGPWLDEFRSKGLTVTDNYNIRNYKNPWFTFARIVAYVVIIGFLVGMSFYIYFNYEFIFGSG